MGIEVLVTWMESSLTALVIAAVGLGGSSLALMFGLGVAD